MGDDQSDQIKRWFLSFLGREEFNYEEKVLNLIQREERRLIISLDHLRELEDEDQFQGCLNDLVNNPVAHIPVFEEAIAEYATALRERAQEELPPIEGERFFVGIEGAFGSLSLSPRSVETEHIGKLVAVEGISTRVSLVRPKVIKSVHFSETSFKHTTRQYA